jgi:UDP-N-acetylmuramoyl-L-alanyl-D-glutamate--2,6-diaminopimelate ligase
MRFDELTAGAIPGLRAIAPTPRPVELTGLAYDSRRVEAGSLFFCVVGYERDGHDFAGAAVAAGASALVVERPLGLGVPEIVVESARAAMAPLAARFYGEPTRELRVVGVTGTNGKTTTAHLLRALLGAGGERCGLLGTVESIVAGVHRPATRTTPEAIDLQTDFRAMLDGGERYCAMEVSSHALALGRTDAVHFAAAIFTNLTQDHLDFHETMEDYFQAKRRLFVGAVAARPRAGGASVEEGGESWPAVLGVEGGESRPAEPGVEDGGESQFAKPGVAVVNLDDPYGRRLAAELDDVVTFAIDSDADYCAHDVRVELTCSQFELHTPAGARTLSLPLPGRFNVANALGALAATHALGGELDALVAALERGVRVPGRLEPVEEGQGFAVLVDYAHTPDSLENVLRTAHEVARGRVICVFGAGGDRDRGKRPLMGEIGARLSDVLFVTSDNPRSEDPEAIVAEIMAGAGSASRPPGAPRVEAEVNRRVAIERAISLAGRGDVLVIAGKGHEQGQELAGGVKVPFDDVTVAREALGARVR